MDTTYVFKYISANFALEWRAGLRIRIMQGNLIDNGSNNVIQPFSRSDVVYSWFKGAYK
jgi:hypothetical protein